MRFISVPLIANALEVKSSDPWQGDKCTWTQRRMADPKTDKQWKEFRNSDKSFHDSTFDVFDMIYNQDNIDAGQVDLDEMMLNGPWSYKSPKKTAEYPYLWGKNGVQAKDMQTGAINDTWLLGAAGSIAAYKTERIKRIFVNQDFTKSGIFQTQLYYKGVK